MASLFLLAQLLGRQRSSLVPLMLAAAIMVSLNPQILWDASFQLSFLAMGGLVFAFPPLQSLGRRTIKARIGEEGALVSLSNFAVDGFSVTLGALIFVWPVIAYYFGIISFASPIATFMALPALPFAIIFGAPAAILGLFIVPLAQVTSWFGWLFLSYILAVASVFAAIPVSFIEIDSMSVHFIWIYYLCLGLILLASTHTRQAINLITKLISLANSFKFKTASFFLRLSPKWVVPPLAIIASLIWIAALNMPDDKLHVSFIDVDEGDAILIQNSAHHDILIDGGPSPQEITASLGDKMPFWDRNIDLVILTHPHEDHLAGLLEVLKRYDVKEVLYPALEFQSPAYDEWSRLIQENKIKSTLAQSGQEINLGDETSITILNPPGHPPDYNEDPINNNSVVLRLNMNELSFLFAADIQHEAEFELLRSGMNLNSTVLKVAHHGSETSTTGEFLCSVNPQIAVISADSSSNPNHPSIGVLERLKAKINPDYIIPNRPERNG